MDDPIREASLAVAGNLNIPAHDDGEDKTSLRNLRWMRHRILTDPTMTTDKISRWIGFIQGCMACKGFLETDEERAKTRPLFHEAYAKAGLIVPPSLTMELDTSWLEHERVMRETD